jgi:adenylate cyclase
LRLYLERYPDGAFADLARTRPDRGPSELEDPAIEVSFWTTVRDSKEATIRAYLQRYPQRKFVSLADIFLSTAEL